MEEAMLSWRGSNAILQGNQCAMKKPIEKAQFVDEFILVGVCEPDRTMDFWPQILLLRDNRNMTMPLISSL